MEKKEYLLGVTIIEGRYLKGKDFAGTSDPFVKLSCANLAPQVTMTKYQTNTAVWKQSFTFPQLLMNQYELESFELILEVFDHNALVTNELIGQYSIGLSTLYRNLNHEYYKVWLTLFNPKFPNEAQGYLLVSCFIVGPNERPPAHAQDEQEEDEEELDEEILKGLTEDQKIALMKKKQGIYLLQEPNIIRKGYQLSVNVLKAEALPQCDSSGNCNSFVSVRCVSCVQTTRVVEQNFNPLFGSKLCFPIYIPILNDKITVRIWSQGNRSTTFIANIPEFPSHKDFFNITKLLSCDGKMKASWFNLYGVHPQEKGWFTNNNVAKKEGSSYLGRVLVSMHLTPHELPQLITNVANPAKEPQSSNFLLWVDAYNLVNCEEANGKPLWIVASIGHLQTQKHMAKYKETTKTYQWNKISLKALQVNFPNDLRQTPDIFINVYAEKAFGGEYRIGYIRIPARNCLKKTSNPEWYRLKSPLNDTTCPGIILMNIQYIVQEGNDIERIPKERSIETKYHFYAQILSGFEIAPSLSEENLNTKVDIKIGNLVSSKDIIITNNALGRYPFWNYCIHKEISLDSNLDFASDMRVILYNCQKSLVLRKLEWNQFIGEFSVPVSSLHQNNIRKPQYFNVINNDGTLQGQILARFNLKSIDKKRKRDENYQNALQELKQITDIKYKHANIRVSIIGIRNLINNVKKPVIKLKLTNSEQEPIIIKLDEEANTKNPNFGKIAIFENIPLPNELLLWPMLEITIQDEGKVFGMGGCETCYTTISLFEFADIDEDEIKFSKAQLNKNQNKLNLVQRQLNDEEYQEKIEKEAQKDEESDSEKNDSINDIDQDDNNIIIGNQYKDSDYSQSNNDIQKYYDDSSDSLDADDVKIDIRDNDQKITKKKSEQQKLNKGYSSKKKRENQPQSQFNFFRQEGVQIDSQIEVDCTKQNKDDEATLRQKKAEELGIIRDDLILQISKTQSKQVKEQKTLQLIAIKNQIDELEEEKMDEKKFWGYIMDENEEFQYGREVFKEGIYEDQLILPYKEFPLFASTSSWLTNKTSHVGGMLRSGILTGAILKASIQVKTGAQQQQPQESEGNENEKNEEDLRTISKKYPYDLTNQIFLNHMIRDYKPFKVRLYILTCQNLSAVDSCVDFKSKLAGMRALCSADPFPIIVVGDGKNDKRQQKVKYVNDRDKNINQDLNPKFYRSYEFDANFPEDWKIEIQICDKGRLQYTDALIGSTIIDLEDRLNGNLRNLMLKSLDIHKKNANNIIQLEEEKDQQDQDREKIKHQEDIKDQIVRSKTNINTKDQKPVPIEFRELRHPNKKQAQGMIEMWIEVLEIEEARKIPMAKLQVQNKEEYEIRLIIWETRDVPLTNGDSVDIYLKVIFDPTGWAGNEIEKKTDIHYSSKDGRGVFNYRFKFSLETPCDFPRLKFALYDYGVISDEAIGESVLNLKKTMALLQKEGRLEIPKTWLSFQHPNKKNEERGQALISMQIVPKVEAEGNPVGEAWNEPNENPRLEKPMLGRGFKDKLAATAIDVSKFKIPKLNMFRNFMIIGIVALVVIVVLIIIMFLK